MERHLLIGKCGELQTEAMKLEIWPALINGEQEVLDSSGGNAINLGSLRSNPEDGVNVSVEWGINDFGVIVGYSETNTNGTVGFVYFNGTMYDLNTLVNSTGNGLTITSANGINDLGQIVGEATDVAGIGHAVIITIVGAKSTSLSVIQK